MSPDRSHRRALQQVPRPHPAAPQAATREATLVVGFSTRLPPDLIERLRIAAPQLGLRQADITAAALDTYLRANGH